jgi:hypothetical protein
MSQTKEEEEEKDRKANASGSGQTGVRSSAQEELSSGSFDLTGAKGTLSRQSTAAGTTAQPNRRVPIMTDRDAEAAFGGISGKTEAAQTLRRNRAGYQAKKPFEMQAPRRMSLPTFSRLSEPGYMTKSQPGSSGAQTRSNSNSNAEESIAGTGAYSNAGAGMAPSRRPQGGGTPTDIGRSGGPADNGVLSSSQVDSIRQGAASAEWPTPNGEYSQYVRDCHQIGRSFDALEAMRQWSKKGALSAIMRTESWARALGPLFAQNRTELERSDTEGGGVGFQLAGSAVVPGSANR